MWLLSEIAILFNICFLICILLISIKYLLRFLLPKHNGRFYNLIVKNKSVHILTSGSDSTEFRADFMSKSTFYDIAGFDCEWAPDKSISLIQFSFPDGCTFLIRLLNGKDHLPVEVVQWLKDGSKLKFGVGVLEDAQKLESQWNIALQGSVDLRHLAVRVKPNGLDKMGLKSLASQWLHVDYPYDIDSSRLKLVQCSNWEQLELSNEQIEYACLDGIVGALCPIEFLCRKLSMTPTEAMTNINRIKSYCQGCIDFKFKSKTKHQKNPNSCYHNRKAPKNLEKLYSRITPIYDNASLLSPDGEMLSRLSRKKADWYIKRNLGVKVSDEPLVVKLLFEPSGRASCENDYYVQEKENLCVVCGSTGNCIKKNVVPIEYRRHYPITHKSHKSHDVLPLCIDCHRRGNIMDFYKKKEIATLNNAPQAPIETIDHNKSRVRNAARAIRFKDKIPANRVKELWSMVADYHGVDLAITDSEAMEKLLDEAVNMSIGKEQDGARMMVPHGQVVVDRLKNELDLAKFEIMWREHFVNSLQPKYLPAGWSTHHRVEMYGLPELQ